MKLACAPLISVLQFVVLIKLNWQSFKGSHIPVLTNLQNIITTFHSHHRSKIRLSNHHQYFSEPLSEEWATYRSFFGSSFSYSCCSGPAMNWLFK